MNDSVIDEILNMIKACGRSPADFEVAAGEEKSIAVTNTKNGKTQSYDSSDANCVMNLAVDLKTGKI